MKARSTRPPPLRDAVSKLTMPDLATGVQEALDVDRAFAARLVDAAEPLWEVLAEKGLVDSFGGMECRRVLPATLAFIRREANPGPNEEPSRVGFVPADRGAA